MKYMEATKGMLQRARQEELDQRITKLLMRHLTWRGAIDAWHRDSSPSTSRFDINGCPMFSNLQDWKLIFVVLALSKPNFPWTPHRVANK